MGYAPNAMMDTFCQVIGAIKMHSRIKGATFCYQMKSVCCANRALTKSMGSVSYLQKPSLQSYPTSVVLHLILDLDHLDQPKLQQVHPFHLHSLPLQAQLQLIYLPQPMYHLVLLPLFLEPGQLKILSDLMAVPLITHLVQQVLSEILVLEIQALLLEDLKQLKAFQIVKFQTPLEDA